QLPWRQLRLIQRQLHDLTTHIVRNSVPDAVRPGRSVFQGLRPAALVEVAPSVKGGARDAELLQRPARRQMGLLNQPDDLQLFGSWIPHSSLSPSAIMLFLTRRNSRACSATTSFSARASRRRSLTSPLVAARAVSPARRRLPASRKSFDQVEHRLSAMPSRRHTSAMLSSPP